MVCRLQKILLVVQLFIIAVCYGRQFQNPILKGLKDAKVIEYGTLYYMVATEETGNSFNWFPIYESANLVNWTLIAHTFDSENIPIWTTAYEIWTPFLHYDGEYFYVFFSAADHSSYQYKIGVVKSRSITGPYVVESKRLAIQTDWNLNPSVIADNTNGDTYLMWSSWNGSRSTKIWGQRINLATLTMDEGSPTILLTPTLFWESDYASSYPVYRNSFYYIFYAGNDECLEDSLIGVARSNSPLGPYEKLPNAIIGRSAVTANIVKDVDGSSDVVLYQWKCSPSFLYASTLVWGSNNWPALS